jgi:hypothetical protein
MFTYLPFQGRCLYKSPFLLCDVAFSRDLGFLLSLRKVLADGATIRSRIFRAISYFKHFFFIDLLVNDVH